MSVTSPEPRNLKGSGIRSQNTREKVFVNRSPVLDQSKRICAYRLDFIECAKRYDGLSVRTPGGEAVNAFLEASPPETVTSGRRGFVKCGLEEAGSLMGHAAWKGKIVPVLDAAALEKGTMPELSSMLGTFCLDNLVFIETMKPLFSSHCIATIGVAHQEEAALSAHVWSLKSFLVTPFATSVDTREAFDLACRAGFDLFHGEFFRKPSVLTKASISPNHALLLSLSAHAARDADITVVEEIFKKNPDLTFGLLNLVRSAFFHVPEDVTSIKQAITLLGYKNLQKWASLMLFTINHSDPSTNPLFENALVRARTMETAAAQGLKDAAYMTGIFSIVPALFDVGIEEIVAKANFAFEIREALLFRKGTLGAMLEIVEGIERGAYEKTNEMAHTLGIGLDAFLAAQSTAFAECAAPRHTPPQARGMEEAKRLPQEAAPTEKPSWLSRVHGFFRR